MILILSEENDISALKTSEWIKYLSPDVLLELIDNSTLIRKVSSDVGEENIFIELDNQKSISLREVQSFWYRRGDLCLDFSYDSSLDETELLFLEKEWKAIKEYLYIYLEN